MKRTRKTTNYAKRHIRTKAILDKKEIKALAREMKMYVVNLKKQEIELKQQGKKMSKFIEDMLKGKYKNITIKK